MKKTFEIAFVYIGLVIGAGFASGREILEYFNNTHQKDYGGIVLAVLGFAAISFIIMHYSSMLGTNDFDSFIDHTAKKLSFMVKLFMLLYMFCGLFVMMAGSGALFSRMFNVSPSYGIFILALLCFIIFSFDVKGLVTVNAIMVPIMIVGIFILCTVTAVSDIAPTFSFADSIRKNHFISAFCYVSYNTITAGAVLIPLAKQTERKKLLCSSLISSFTLGILIFIVWTVQNIYYNLIWKSEMPLFDIAIMHGKLWEIIYTIVLFMALCTTAVSHGFGILSKFNLPKKSDKVLASLALCLCAMPFARIGFSELVANLYSAFGFLGLIWLIFLVISYLSYGKK